MAQDNILEAYGYLVTESENFMERVTVLICARENWQPVLIPGVGTPMEYFLGLVAPEHADDHLVYFVQEWELSIATARDRFGPANVERVLVFLGYEKDGRLRTEAAKE